MRIAEMSPAQTERCQSLWNELVEQCRSGPLPFVKPDPVNPQGIASLWDATASDNEAEDTSSERDREWSLSRPPQPLEPIRFLSPPFLRRQVNICRRSGNIVSTQALAVLTTNSRAAAKQVNQTGDDPNRSDDLQKQCPFD